MTIQNDTSDDDFMGVFSYTGMPPEEADRNARLIAFGVMPELASWVPVEDRSGIPV